jgi:glycosyltransferase involved in cell wall biosynthesis
MPRVLRIINRFNLGGITYNVSYLSRYMSPNFVTKLIGGPEEEGEESSLFIPHNLGLQPELILEMRRSVNPFSDYFAYRKIKKIIREFRPDIVHTHASKAGAIGRLAAIHCNVPVIVHTFHGHVFKGYFGSFKTRIFQNIERYLSKRSSAIIAISEIQKKELTQVYKVCSTAQTVVIPLGFDLVRFTQDQSEKRRTFRLRFQIQENELAIGIIGRLAPIKHHTLFIDAIEALFLQTQKSFKAIIIGDGETRIFLENYVQQKPKEVQSQIVFAGWIREVDVALAGLDLVCLSSKNEGTPVSLIEAQAAKKFIVSTNVGGIADILHPSCGLLSEPGDLDAFARNLCLAVNDFEIYSSQAGLASEQVIQGFSYQRLCNDMEHLYSKLLKPN